MAALRFILIFGPPASGKTTTARSVESQLRQRGEGDVCRISFDEWRGSYACLRDKHQAIHEHVSGLSGTVILDDTFHLRGMRKMYWNLCRTRENVGIVFVRCSASLEAALLRDAQRPAEMRVGPTSIAKIFGAFEELNREQRQFMLNVDGALCVEAAISLLNQSVRHFDHWRHQAVVDSESSWTSPAHSLVLMLNRRISELIASLPRDDAFNRRASEIVRQKRMLVALIRKDPSTDPMSLLAMLHN